MFWVGSYVVAWGLWGFGKTIARARVPVAWVAQALLRARVASARVLRLGRGQGDWVLALLRALGRVFARVSRRGLA